MSLKLTVLALFFFAAAFEIDAFQTDYTYIRSTKCFYKLFKNRVSWTNAVSNCKNEGGQLFIPENESEVEEVLSAVDVINENWIWIGIADLKNEHAYKTIDGRSVDHVYKNWKSGNPGKTAGHTCVTLQVRERTLMSYDCSANQYYICKKVLWAADLIEEAKKSIVATMEQQTSNQVAALERLAERMQRHAADQSTAWELLAEAVANQTLAVERQALAVEKLANDAIQLEDRSEQ